MPYMCHDCMFTEHSALRSNIESKYNIYRASVRENICVILYQRGYYTITVILLNHGDGAKIPTSDCLVLETEPLTEPFFSSKSGTIVFSIWNDTWAAAVLCSAVIKCSESHEQPRETEKNSVTSVSACIYGDCNGDCSTFTELYFFYI